MINNFKKTLSAIADNCYDIEYMYDELVDENNELRLDKERLQKELEEALDHIYDLETQINDLQETIND